MSTWITREDHPDDFDEMLKRQTGPFWFTRARTIACMVGFSTGHAVKVAMKVEEGGCSACNHWDAFSKITRFAPITPPLDPPAPYDPAAEYLTTAEAAAFCRMPDPATFRNAATRMKIEPEPGHWIVGFWSKAAVEKVDAQFDAPGYAFGRDGNKKEGT
jgi:hypothetical protein